MASKVNPQQRKYIGNGPCRQCDRPQSKCGKLSHRRLCADCGEANMNQAARELRAREGPAYDEWRRAWIDGARRLARQ